MKRLGFISTDGTPTSLYSKFRNEQERGTAMAQVIRHGYKEVFERNEYAHELEKTKFKNLIIEMTGLGPGDTQVGAIVGTFFALKSYAKFDSNKDTAQGESKKKNVVVLENNGDDTLPPLPPRQPASGLNLSYTINLNLPETSDVEVFNAIFRSLKENLLKT